MKEWVATDKVTENPWHDDAFLLKFCRARKFKFDDVKIMFENYMKYRQENGLDTIIAVSKQALICL